MNRLDEALRSMFPASEPLSADLERAEAVYRSGIRTQRHGDAARRQRTLMPVAMAAIVAVAVGVFVTTRPGEVQASLTAIAYAARSVDVADLEEGQFFYTESSATQFQAHTFVDGAQLAYMIDVHRRMWINPGGGTIIETTRSNPRFGSDTDERTYFQQRLDVVDRLGETETIAVDQASHDALERDWPLEPEALADEIRSMPNVETDTDAVDALLNLITESPASTQLRAATVEALGRFRLTVVSGDESQATFRTVPTDGDRQIIQFTISEAGHLVEFSGYTIGRDQLPELFFTASYSPTRSVDRP
jgi:hypothetical protein